jgi:hypothetical protein
VKQHVVRQGEHLARLAAEHGLSSERPLWSHPKNAGLRAKRPSPFILLPGDEVAIPERSEKVVSCATGTLHTFVAGPGPLFVRLALRGLTWAALAGAAVLTRFAGVSEAETDAEGKLAVVIPPQLAAGGLEVGPRALDLRIGHLDPVDEPSGQRGRLLNLGFLSGPAEDDDPDELAFALSDFQADTGLSVTGHADAATRAKLVEKHGS